MCQTAGVEELFRGAAPRPGHYGIICEGSQIVKIFQQKIENAMSINRITGTTSPD